MALLPWVLAVLLPHVKANWEIGAGGLTCDQVCTAVSGACSQDGNRQLNSNFEFDYVFADLVSRSQIPSQYPACDTYQALTDAAVQAQPGTIYMANPDLVRPICYQYSAESTCAGSAGNNNFRRICCCLPNPTDDYLVQCFVPTTTTSTATTETTTSLTTKTSTSTSTQTVTSSTTGTATSTTSLTMTSTATATTTSATISTTVVTTTYTGTTLTTTSLTATSHTTTSTDTASSITVTYTATSVTTTVTSTFTSTQTITSSITSTITVVTQTTTSVTMTSTSATTTTSSTTVTQAAATLVTRTVPAGSSQIPIADRTGFSEGDVILLRNREVVTIENITADTGRRLEDEDDLGDESESFGRILAAEAAILEVTPPVAKEYNPGDSLRNLGPSATYTGSDPITFNGDQKFKFWLPNHQEFMMLETSDLKVFGTVFPGPKSDQQWFGNFRVVLSDDTPVMEVKIKRPVANHSKVARCSSRRMDSMDIFLGQSESPLMELQRRPMEFTAGDDVRFVINCRQQDRPLLASSRTEYIHFETPSIGFLIVAAHAGNEFPDDWRLQLKYMHLDLLILEMPRKNEFKGVLPEIWGTVPRSPEVEAMLSPPTAEETAELAPRVCQEDLLSRQSGSTVCLS